MRTLSQPHAANLNSVDPSRTATLADLPIGALLDALADRLADRLRTHSTDPRHPEHASALHNPLGTPRAFLDAGRRGDFPTFKRGREIVARWADVLAYIERRSVQRRPPNAGPAIRKIASVDRKVGPVEHKITPAKRRVARDEDAENLEILREMGVLRR